ncbi:MAG: hypothetical protein IJI65_07215 [Lachnospiraceae bacterium]|nr:hypothetical protein [Lachnospiraceae bacterium]
MPEENKASLSRMLKIVVSDTGKGIRKEDISRLFKSFQRLDETRNRNIEGTGLGLNITKYFNQDGKGSHWRKIQGHLC